MMWLREAMPGPHVGMFQSSHSVVAFSNGFVNMYLQVCARVCVDANGVCVCFFLYRFVALNNIPQFPSFSLLPLRQQSLGFTHPKEG